MTDHRHEEPGRSPEPVPRDLPDQQAVPDEEDPWEVSPAEEAEDTEGAQGVERDEAPADVPDVDEAGSGRQGAPRSATVHPEHPGPDESPD
ncbi:hypothetical protein [Streptomyces chromofuscus]|uniref:Uncharacterized protein n=1 Tax=Streptomyces chromofuscus TaxID=42881 RepID=A0A7M2T836_STRCW|nr:hypothetical protein [Streptomyces chromofuscus]QOV44384.1 hypothetical protein IPT68_32985 [Streptomyces chromofuscus]GGT23023.1 hypothetical protein GCM10010254_49380 [Streptomyces chromofuscus]